MVKASAYKRLLQRKINIIQKHKDKINEVGNYKLIEDVIQRAVAFRFKGSDYHVYRLDTYEYLVVINLHPVLVPMEDRKSYKPEYTYDFSIVSNPSPKLLEKAKIIFAAIDAKDVHSM